MSEPLEVAMDLEATDTPDPGSGLARDEAVRSALSRFLELAPAQHSSVILKDVLDHSLDEIAALLELSVPAVKAALHRRHERLRELSQAPQSEGPPLVVSPVTSCG